MRCVLIVSIVVGHTFAIYGNLGSTSWILPERIEFISNYSWITPIFISFQLQAFVFISGFLYANSLNSANILSNKKIYLLKKVKRLLIPTIIFGIAYLLVIDQKNIDFPTSVIYLISGPGHLWFLPMLFWCFCFATLFSSLLCKNIRSVYLWIALFAVSIGSIFMPNFFRVNNAMFYMIFFVFGMLAFSCRNKIFMASNNVILIFWITTIILCFAKVSIINLIFQGKIIVNTSLNIILGIVGSISLLMLCNKLKKIKSIVLIGTWGGFFGIYLVHQFIIKLLYYHSSVLVNIPPYLVPFVVLLITLTVSIAISELLLRNRITKQYI